MSCCHSEQMRRSLFEGLCPHGDLLPFPLRKHHFESSASGEVPVACSGDKQWKTKVFDAQFFL